MSVVYANICTQISSRTVQRAASPPPIPPSLPSLPRRQPRGRRSSPRRPQRRRRPTRRRPRRTPERRVHDRRVEPRRRARRPPVDPGRRAAGFLDQTISFTKPIRSRSFGLVLPSLARGQLPMATLETGGIHQVSCGLWRTGWSASHTQRSRGNGRPMASATRHDANMGAYR